MDIFKVYNLLKWESVSDWAWSKKDALDGFGLTYNERYGIRRLFKNEPNLSKLLFIIKKMVLLEAETVLKLPPVFLASIDYDEEPITNWYISLKSSNDKIIRFHSSQIVNKEWVHLEDAEYFYLDKTGLGQNNHNELTQFPKPEIECAYRGHPFLVKISDINTVYSKENFSTKKDEIATAPKTP